MVGTLLLSIFLKGNVTMLVVVRSFTPLNYIIFNNDRNNSINYGLSSLPRSGHKSM